MHRQYNEDLFESSKMTFGEHLEELRWALFKAIGALAIGFLIGLMFGNKLVDYVQTPAKRALEAYYTNLSGKEFRHHLEELRAEGKAIPEDLDAAEQLFREQGLITEERYVDPTELARILREVLPEATVARPESAKSVDEAAPAMPSEAPGNATQGNSAPPPAPSPQPPPDGVRRENLLTLRTYHAVKDDPRVRIIGLRFEEAFVVYIKASLVLGIFLASPPMFYFIWQFVAAGLYPHERRYVRVFLPFSTVLFLAGATLAFFAVLRFVLAFLLTFYSWMGLDPDIKISDYLMLVLILPLGFGIAFQLPLVMLFLERIGMFTVASYLSSWRMAVLIIAFVSAILTPSDPYSMMLMLLPMIGLYFFGVALCRLMPRRASPFGEALD